MYGIALVVIQKWCNPRSRIPSKKHVWDTDLMPVRVVAVWIHQLAVWIPPSADAELIQMIGCSGWPWIINGSQPLSTPLTGDAAEHFTFLYLSWEEIDSKKQKEK